MRKHTSWNQSVNTSASSMWLFWGSVQVQQNTIRSKMWLVSCSLQPESRKKVTPLLYHLTDSMPLLLFNVYIFPLCHCLGAFLLKMKMRSNRLVRWLESHSLTLRLICSKKCRTKKYRNLLEAIQFKNQFSCVLFICCIQCVTLCANLIYLWVRIQQPNPELPFAYSILFMQDVHAVF